jgi:hypothetical protein
MDFRYLSKSSFKIKICSSQMYLIEVVVVKYGSRVGSAEKKEELLVGDNSIKNVAVGLRLATKIEVKETLQDILEHLFYVVNPPGEVSEVVVSLNPSILESMKERSKEEVLDLVSKIEQQARRICPEGEVTLLGLSGHKNYKGDRIHQMNIKLRRVWKSTVLSPTGWLGPKLVWDDDKQDWDSRHALMEMGKLIERAVLRSDY